MNLFTSFVFHYILLIFRTQNCASVKSQRASKKGASAEETVGRAVFLTRSREVVAKRLNLNKNNG